MNDKLTRRQAYNQIKKGNVVRTRKKNRILFYRIHNDKLQAKFKGETWRNFMFTEPKVFLSLAMNNQYSVE